MGRYPNSHTFATSLGGSGNAILYRAQGQRQPVTVVMWEEELAAVDSERGLGATWMLSGTIVAATFTRLFQNSTFQLLSAYSDALDSSLGLRSIKPTLCTGSPSRCVRAEFSSVFASTADGSRRRHETQLTPTTRQVSEYRQRMALFPSIFSRVVTF